MKRKVRVLRAIFTSNVALPNGARLLDVHPTRAKPPTLVRFRRCVEQLIRKDHPVGKQSFGHVCVPWTLAMSQRVADAGPPEQEDCFGRSGG